MESAASRSHWCDSRKKRASWGVAEVISEKELIRVVLVVSFWEGFGVVSSGLDIV